MTKNKPSPLFLIVLGMAFVAVGTVLGLWLASGH